MVSLIVPPTEKIHSMAVSHVSCLGNTRKSLCFILFDAFTFSQVKSGPYEAIMMELLNSLLISGECEGKIIFSLE